MMLFSDVGCFRGELHRMRYVIHPSLTEILPLEANHQTTSLEWGSRREAIKISQLKEEGRAS